MTSAQTTPCGYGSRIALRLCGTAGGGFSDSSFQTATPSPQLLVIASASEAIHRATTHEAGFLRSARNDGCGDGTQTPNVLIPRCAIAHRGMRTLGAGPESITTDGGYGFRARCCASPRNDGGTFARDDTHTSAISRRECVRALL